MANSAATYIPNTTDITSKSTCWGRVWNVKVYEHTDGTISYPNADAQSEKTASDFYGQKSSDIVMNIGNYDEQSGTALSGDSLHCVFGVKRYAMGQPNTATIKVYNLTADAETKMIVEGYRVTVYAGYQQKSGLIFDGFVVYATRTKENGTDYTITLLAIDGYQFLISGYCNFSIQRGITARQVVKSIANRAAAPIEIGYPKDSDTSVLDNQKYTRGQSIHGLARGSLDDIAKALNATWYVDCGKLYFIHFGESSSDLPLGKQAVVLSPETGMIGNPTQIEYGINAKCLLNPEIVPFCFVYLNPQYITLTLPDIGSNGQISNTQLYQLDSKGLYRVVSCEFVGDTRGNDWYTEINAVIQNGTRPQMLTATGTMN